MCKSLHKQGNYLQFYRITSCITTYYTFCMIIIKCMKKRKIFGQVRFYAYLCSGKKTRREFFFCCEEHCRELITGILARLYITFLQAVLPRTS